MTNHKCPCSACGTNIAFPEDYLNQQVTCPSCGVQTLLTLPAVAPPAPRAVAVRAVASNAATTPQGGGPGLASLRGIICISMLAISALVLVSAYIAWVPVPFVMELGRKNSFIGNWGAGAFTLGWVGIAGTLGCCALTVQASVGKKVLTLIVLGLAAVGQIIWSIDIISTNLAQKPMMLPASMGYVFFFLKLGSILIAALSLRGWPRWTVIGLGIAAMFSSAVGDGIGIALDKKALTASIGLEWARWLAYAGFSVLAFGAAAVSLFAVFRKPAQATPEPSASASPTTPATASTAQASRHQPTSRVLYVVLGLFFGCLGVHNFLAGYTRKGIIQLLITLCTFFFGAFFVAIWALIEIFTVKADADGVPFT